MGYFKDLTPYKYFLSLEPVDITTLNVGWLSHEESFAVGETSHAFQDRLLRFCHDSNVVRIARGFHVCELCGVSIDEWYADGKEKYGTDTHWASIGDGEIRIFGKDVVYAAPALVYHYIIEHGYRPPDAFVDAVLTGPAPDSSEYENLLKPWRRKTFRVPVQGAADNDGAGPPPNALA